MKRKYIIALIIVLILSSCAKQAQPVPPTVTFVRPAETIARSTPTPPEIPTDTPFPAPTQDPTLFGAIAQGGIQAFSLEPVANAIFSKVMDDFIADGNIIEYQVTHVAIFPSSDGGLLAEIIYNVRTTDSAWLEESGTSASDNRINDKCNRFDFVTTDTEFQLKNRRTCN